MSRTVLRSYGVSMMLLCGVLGAYLRLAAPLTASVVWVLGGLALVLAVVAPMRLQPVYRAWMIVTWPLRWLVSHLALGILFFGVVTPIGWLMRLRGHDPLRLRTHTSLETTLWTEVKPDDGPDRVFQQF